MNTLVNIIIGFIEDQINQHEVNLIRLEGIESPLIYEGIIKQLNIHYGDKIEILAKLSEEKFLQFKESNNFDWKNALDYLQVNNYVDVDNAMTKWRNSTSYGVKDNGRLTLLMGTEAVQDKGGLGDFYLISPSVIIEIIGGKYSVWFGEILPEFLTDKEAANAIDTLFKVIYNKENVDIQKLGLLIDELSLIDFHTPQEVIDEICFRLNKYFKIPCICEKSKIPKISRLKQKKLTSANVISKAQEFINRSMFNKTFLKDNKINEYIQKIEQYSEEKQIDKQSPFPEYNAKFNNYEEFSECLIEFIKGQYIDKNRDKLMQVDFSIIMDILKIKPEVKASPASKRETENNIKGDPISVYTHMILDSIQKFNELYKELPNKVTISVDSIKLSGCIKDDLNLEKEFLYAALGGIVDYINCENIIDFNNEIIKISYLDDIDVFTKCSSDKEKVEWGTTTKINDLCKMKFSIFASNDDNEEKNKYVWMYEDQNEWKHIFKEIIVEKIKNEDGEISPFIRIKNIGELFNSESEEAFFTKLDRCRITFDSTIVDKVREGFEDKYEMIESYNKITYLFNHVVNNVMENGLFSSILNQDIPRFISEYSKFISICSNNIEEYTTNQLEVISLLANIFCIKDEDISKDERIIIPSFHPIMLEKLTSKLTYLRGIYGETFELIKNTYNISSSSIIHRIQRGNQLATIACGADVILNNKKLMSCSHIYGLYALYGEDKDKRGICSSEVDIRELDATNYQLLQVKPYTKIIKEYVSDYIRTFPARCDGLNLLFVNPIDIDHIIDAMDSIREDLQSKMMPARINLRICLPYTRSSAIDYLRSWSEIMGEEASNVEINTFVTYLSSNNYENILYNNFNREDVIDNDVAFMYRVLVPGEPEFKLCKMEQEESYDYKFPTTIVPEPIAEGQTKRYLNVSQYQFETVKCYTTLAHLIYEPNAIKGQYIVQRVLNMGQQQPQFINELHKKSNWVVCMDEAIDKNTIQSNIGKVIGFTSGEGNSGELNITLSTREDVLNDICNKLSQQILKKFSGWTKDTIDKINNKIISIAKELDGSKILKALNPNDYAIYNFLAYVLVAGEIKKVEDSSKALVSSLINLDTHLHWFSTIGRNQDFEKTQRPDLLLLEIENSPHNLDINEDLQIKATIIECKMGRENMDTVYKAQEQVENGMRILAKNWETVIKRTNNKYWYNQLYRTLVFNPIRSSDNTEEFKIISEKMRRINEGRFSIKWEGRIYGFWLNSIQEELDVKILETDIHDEISNVEDIKYYSAGQPYIKEQLNTFNKEENSIEIDDVLIEYEEDKEFEDTVIEFLSQHKDEVFIKDRDSKQINTKVEDDISSVINTEKRLSTAVEIDDGNTIELCIEVDSNKNKELGSYDKLDNTIVQSNQDNNLSREVNTTNSSNVESKEKKEHNINNIRVLLGEDIRTKEKIYWEFGNKQLNNRHLLISGNSGTGKTYCIQTLMYEMISQGISCIVFDYTDGFTPSKLDPILVDKLKDRIEQRIVVRDKFPLNPFKRLDIEIGDIRIPESTPAVAARMASVFKSVYRFGMQQNGIIYNSIKEGMEESEELMTFAIMADKLRETGNATAASVLSKVQAFLDIDPFGTKEDFSWQDIMDKKGQLYVIQLTGFPRDIQLLLTEFILWDVWNFCVKYGDETKPLPIIIDEAQNLSHGCDSPTGKILTEGRKFGISGWFATQFLKGALKDDEIQRLQQAGQKLYFSPPEREVTDIAKSIDINNENAKEWAEKLKKLQKGVCVTCGQMVKNNTLRKYEPKIINITSLKERTDETD